MVREMREKQEESPLQRPNFEEGSSGIVGIQQSSSEVGTEVATV